MARESVKIDQKDRKIITLLHDNQEISQEEIAKLVHLSQPSVAMRIKKLKERGFNYECGQFKDGGMLFWKFK